MEKKRKFTLDLSSWDLIVLRCALHNHMHTGENEKQRNQAKLLLKRLHEHELLKNN